MKTKQIKLVGTDRLATRKQLPRPLVELITKLADHEPVGDVRTTISPKLRGISIKNISESLTVLNIAEISAITASAFAHRAAPVSADAILEQTRSILSEELVRKQNRVAGVDKFLRNRIENVAIVLMVLGSISGMALGFIVGGLSLLWSIPISTIIKELIATGLGLGGGAISGLLVARGIDKVYDKIEKALNPRKHIAKLLSERVGLATDIEQELGALADGNTQQPKKLLTDKGSL